MWGAGWVGSVVEGERDVMTGRGPGKAWCQAPPNWADGGEGGRCDCGNSTDSRHRGDAGALHAAVVIAL